METDFGIDLIMEQEEAIFQENRNLNEEKIFRLLLIAELREVNINLANIELNLRRRNGE